jgi:hypothetical protein
MEARRMRINLTQNPADDVNSQSPDGQWMTCQQPGRQLGNLCHPDNGD